MKLNEISKNMDKLSDKKELNKSLDKMTLSILEVIRSDPHYYKDKKYARELILSVEKLNKKDQK